MDYAETATWLQKAAGQRLAKTRIILELLHVGDDGATAPSHIGAAIAEVVAGGKDAPMDNRRRDQLSLDADLDHLTGVWNRPAFLRDFQAKIDGFRNSESVGAGVRGLCVLVVKLDPVEHGSVDADYRTRDAVLCGLADRLSDKLRQSDMIGRIDVDEFAVCIAGIALHDAKALAERLRRAVAMEPFETQLGPLSVAVRIGVAAIKVGESPLSQLQRANDTALVGCSEMKMQPRHD